MTSIEILLKRVRFIYRISLKTLYFNLYYLPFHQAIHFPILVSRKVYLKRPFGKIRLDAPATFGLIRIGFGDVGIFDDRFSRSIWDVSGLVVFKGKTELGHGSKITVAETGVLEFGKDFTITAESTVIAYKSICFGENCMLSWDVLIMDTDLHRIKDQNGEIINNDAPISIGNNVWIGCRSIILKGTSIPDYVVIGANSQTRNSLDEQHCVYAGSPLRKIRESINWER